MKKLIKLYLLLMLIVAPFALAHAQDANLTGNPRVGVYSDPKVMAAVDFLKDRLPQLIVENKAQAVEEYLIHYESLSKLDEADLLYLVGHFYSVVDDPKSAIPYFDVLINDPKLGDDARMMLNLLLYYRAVDYIQKQDKQTAAPFLEDVLNRFSTGKYYPTYMFLWADLLAEDAEESKVQGYIDAYEKNKNWITDSFVRRRNNIISRLEQLDLKSFYADPTLAKAEVLKEKVSVIQKDLQDLYNEFKAIPGLQFTEALDRIATEEMRLLDNLKEYIQPFKSLPPIDLDLMASPDFSGPDTEVFAKYRQGAILLKQLKDTSAMYGRVLDIMDRFFDRRYDLFESEDASVVGKGFSDMEMKRLMDIERNIFLYTDVVDRIDEIMAEQNYSSLNIDLLPERQEYVEKIADLQNRKERYLSFRKHQDNVEEALFMELLDEYYATYRDKRSLDNLLPELEDVMVSMIRENYPKDQQQVIDEQYQLALEAGKGQFPIDETFIANLDFLGLMVDYRRIHYREQLGKARADSLSEDEQRAQYLAIVKEKADLLKRHEDFVASNPDFKAMEQPSGGYLLNNAVIYYNMAELQYAVDLDQPEKALAYYQRALEIEPDFFLRDRALYNTGYLSSEIKRVTKYNQMEQFRKTNPYQERPEELKFTEEDFQDAINAYTELVDSGKYDDSPFHDEAIYRLGVLYFLIGSDANEPGNYYSAANRRFDKLVDDPDSEYHYNALYQRAWVNLNQGDEESLKLALADLVTLIGAVDGEKITDPYQSQDYKNNAIDNIAYSLIALDGVDFGKKSQGVEEVRRVMADYSDIKVKTMILDKAAGLKVDMEAPLQAIDFMELRLQTSPFELQNPAVVDSIIKLYHTPGLQLRPGMELASIRNSKYDFIKDNYGQGTQWYVDNVQSASERSPELARQLQIIRDAYDQIRIRHYNNLVDSASDQDKALYDEHVAAFENYTELFTDNADLQAFKDENRRTTALLASATAEKRNTALDYLAAITSLRDFNRDFSGNPDFFNNEGLIYRYHQRVYEQLSPKFEDPNYAPAAGLPKDKAELYTGYRDAALRFYGVLVGSDNTQAKNGAPAILMELARIELEHGYPEKAKEHYYTILNSGIQIDRSTSRSLYLNLAKIEEEADNFAEAEKMYLAAKGFADDTADADEIENLARLQIQSNYEKAEQSGDQKTAAEELIRLAQKFADEPARSQSYLFLASEAYVKAGMYPEAIQLKTDLAGVKSSMDEKFTLFEQSWTIAEEQMNNNARARSLKNAFISEFPKSNLAFNLRVDLIDEMSKVPAERNAAAQMYIDLHDDVKAGRIDSGDVLPETIYLWAVDIYREDGNQDKVVETLTYFTQTYPNHKQNVDFLTLLADAYLARNDQQRFEYYARELYRLDKKKPERYLNVANRKLGTLAQEFDTAYANKDWDLAFRKRDEFKQMEAEYRKERLPVDSAKAYEAFAFAENEYNTLQSRQAYLKEFDQLLDNIERGTFLGSTPNQLMPVSGVTTWTKHLFGGTPNLVPTLKIKADLEVQKIVKLLEKKEADYLDNQRRLRALSAICQINDYAAQVVETQINKYIQASNEIAPFRNRGQVSQEEFDAMVNTEIKPATQEYIDAYYHNSSTIYLDIYNKYYTAGYYDQYTTRAEDKLIERNLLPEYDEKRFTLDSEWSAMLELPAGGSRKVSSGFGTQTLDDGRVLSSFNLPGHHNLILERNFDFQVKPEFAYVYLAYEQDPEIRVNGKNLDLTYIPVAEEDFGTVYAVRLGGDALREGKNSFRGSFPNALGEDMPVYFGSSFFFIAAKPEVEPSPQTTKILTDTNWTVISKDPQTNEELRSKAVPAVNFDLPMDRSVFLQDTAAKPIWTTETQDNLQTTVIFETEFEIDTAFVKGYLDFVAPDNARLYLNGKALGPVYQLSFNTDPFLVYPARADLPADYLLSGQNRLRVEVQNYSPNRGFIAELSLTQSAKE